MDRRAWKLKRKGKDITLQEIANYVGTSISTISRYENGKRDMQDWQIQRYKEYIEKKVI